MPLFFQQRWKYKAAVRNPAYHGDYIPTISLEKFFKRWYLPDSLPDVRPRRQIFSGDNLNLELYARRKAKETKQGLGPVGSLMFFEVERRIDTVVFRSFFAHSNYTRRCLAEWKEGLFVDSDPFIRMLLRVPHLEI